MSVCIAVRKLTEDRKDALQKCHAQGCEENLKPVRKFYADEMYALRCEQEIERITAEVEKIERSEKDSRAVWNGIRNICGNKPFSSSTKPSQFTKPDGSTAFYENSEELAVKWKQFAESKFSATSTEQEVRPEMDDIEPQHLVKVPSYDDLNKCLFNMKRDKATGPDKIPVEVYINSEYCRHALFDLIIHMFDHIFLLFWNSGLSFGK